MLMGGWGSAVVGGILARMVWLLLGALVYALDRRGESDCITSLHFHTAVENDTCVGVEVRQARRSLKLVERPVEQSKSVFRDDMQWHFADLVGQALDIVERANVLFREACGGVRVAAQDREAGGDVVEPCVGDAPVVAACGSR